MRGTPPPTATGAPATGSLPDHTAHATRSGPRPHLVALALIATFFIVRAPTTAAFLVNWDSVNFALGVESFDLEHHQPHPPGYIGYILLARAVRWVGGVDTNTALTGISLLSGAIAPALLYLAAARFASTRAAVGVAVLFGTSPLVWYYSSVALSYMIGGAVALGVAWACHVARTERSTAHLYLAATLLALLGALRQTDIVLLAPLVAYAAMVFAARHRARALLIVGFLSAVWAVPLIWSAGGPDTYLGLSAELAELTGGRTSLLSGGLIGLGRNLVLFGLGLLFGIGVLGAVWAVARRHRVRLLDGLDRQDRIFLAIWTTPPAFVFLFIHTGQLGYVLTLIPACYIVAATMIDRTSAARRSVPASGRRRPTAAMALAVLLAVNITIYFGAPDQAVALIRARQVDDSQPGSGHRTSVLERTREFHVSLNDAHWRSVQESVREYDPETTVLFALPHSAGSFRHLSYYLPEFEVYGIGHDRSGRFGHLFTVQEMSADYTVGGLQSAERGLTLPASVERVLVLDQSIRRRLADIGEHDEVELHGGLTMLEVDLEGGASLLFAGPDGEAVIPPQR